jgi:hypothetical protein
MLAVHTPEFEVPDDDPRLGELVAGATEGNVVYLTRRGERLAAVIPLDRVAGVRGAILADTDLTDDQKTALLSLVDSLTAANARAAAVDQAWFWTPEWQAGEREADAEIAAGRGQVFGSDEEFLAVLEAAVEDPSVLR